MRQILMPQKQDSGLGLLGGIAGGVAGGIYGGPMGAIEGYQTGNMAGGAIDNLTASDPVTAVPLSGQGVAPAPQSSRGLMDIIGNGMSVYQGAKGLEGMAGQGANAGAGNESSLMLSDPATQSSPILRRQQQLENDPVYNLNRARKALAFQSEDVRKEYEPVINQALIQAQRERQYNNRGLA